MSAETIATVVQMLSNLPDATQEQIAEHLRDYIDDLQDELRWQETFTNNPTPLLQQAQLAKQQIAAGKAKPLDIGEL